MKGLQPLMYYPIFLNIHAKRCVVIGGGEVATRRVMALLSCGADVTVVSPTLHPDLAQLAEAKAISVINRGYETGDLKDAFIAIAATDMSGTNRRVGDEARKRCILVNVVDSSGESDFIVPAVLQRGDLTVAISTAGRSPALARKIRTRLEQNIGKEYSVLLNLVKEVRWELRKQKKAVRGDLWQEALDLDVLLGLLRTGQRKKAKAFLFAKLEANKEKR